MIDTTMETLVSFNQAAAELPRRRRGRKTNVSTLYRWASAGCRGVVMESLQIGGTRCTSKEALQRFFETLTGSHSMQGKWVVILAVAAFFAGLCGKRLRARPAPQARQEPRWSTPQSWRRRRWGRDEGVVPFKWEATSVTDAAEQLRLVMGAEFEKRPLLSRSEAQVLYAAERAVNTADLNWRVMAQVSLGEVLACRDARAYSAINSKRVDLLIVSTKELPRREMLQRKRRCERLGSRTSGSHPTAALRKWSA